jgi:hypothetical protein
MKKACIKSLTAILVFTLLLSALPIYAGASEFTDSAEINPKYLEAVQTLVTRGIIVGYTNGSFQPKATVTREEAAFIIAKMMLGVKAVGALAVTSDVFSDVQSTRWSAPAIAYCKEMGVISGYGGDSFGPTDNVTCLQFAKMLLCVIEKGSSNDYSGASWAASVERDALSTGIFDSTEGLEYAGAATREEAAYFAYMAICYKEENTIEVTSAKFYFYRASNEEGKIETLYRNTDKEIGIALTIGHEKATTQSQARITVRFKLSNGAYDAQQTSVLIPIKENEETTQYNYVLPLADLNEFEVNHYDANKYTAEVKYIVEILYENNVLASSYITTLWDTTEEKAFAKTATADIKLYEPSNDNIEFRTAFVGDVKKLGVSINLNYPELKTGDSMNIPLTVDLNGISGYITGNFTERVDCKDGSCSYLFYWQMNDGTSFKKGQYTVSVSSNSVPLGKVTFTVS